MLLRNSRILFSKIFVLVGIWFFTASQTALTAQRVVLQLKNGDRLTGAVVSENTNHIVFKTTWSGGIIVPLTEVLARELSPLIGLTNTSVVATNSVTNVLAKAKPEPTDITPLKARHWHGEAQVGTDLGFSEKDRQLYYGRFKVTYAREIAPQRFFKNTFDFSSTYGKTDGITSANQANGSSKTDFDTTKRVFVYNLVGAGYDEIRKIDFQYEVGPGVGYHVIMQTNFALNAEAGMNFQSQQFAAHESLERYFFRFAQDFRWVITHKLNFDEKFEFFPRDDIEQYRFRFESNLRYTFFESFIFTFTLLDIFDTQPAKGVSPNDLQIRSSLGVKF